MSFRSRSGSCPSSFNRFKLSKDPSTLTKQELKSILAEESTHSSENPTKYKFGGYMSVELGSALGSLNEYHILRKVGWGQFSTVWLCRHRLHSPGYYSIKIMKSSEKYKNAALNEISLLLHVKNHQNPECIGYDKVVLFHTSFIQWSITGAHLCLVFEAMGSSLHDLLVKSQYTGIYQQGVKIIMKQILTGLKFLHEECKMIHRDLKPENILITPNPSDFDNMITYIRRFNELGVHMPKTYVNALEWQRYVNQYGDPSSSGTVSTEHLSSKTLTFNDDLYIKETRTVGSSQQIPPPMFINSSIQIKIADLGNACRENQHSASVIQTTYYRALEVLIEAGYSFPADIWSAGCIAFELCTGNFLFNTPLYKTCNVQNMTSSEYHLALIWEALGGIPKEIALSGRKSSAYFDETGKFIKINFDDRRICQVENVLTERYGWNNEDSLAFGDFVRCLIEPNPELRETASSGLEHAWLQQ